MKFRDLTEKEIDVRVGQVGDGWATLLLYKDARVDMDILDETVGSENWQRKHYEVKGNMYCSVGIKTADGWVWKDDCGTESNTEKEKGESSDSFKRACVNWGIGRELYTSPKIFIKCDTKDKKILNLKDFYVAKITIKDKDITQLSVNAYDKNRKAEVTVFGSFEKPKASEESEPEMDYETACGLKMKNGKNLDMLENAELEKLLNCGNVKAEKAAKVILEYRKEQLDAVRQMDENGLPWE